VADIKARLTHVMAEHPSSPRAPPFTSSRREKIVSAMIDALRAFAGPSGGLDVDELQPLDPFEVLPIPRREWQPVP
jgi:hypothetical protein